jgi:hypothetical protein
VTPCHGAHRRDQECAETRTLVTGIHLCGQGREGRRRGGVSHGAKANRVDTGREVLERAIPAEGNRPATRHDLIRPLVNKEQLEMGVGGDQRTEVRAGVVAVMVVLRPYGVKEVLALDRLPQIRKFLGRDHLQPGRRIGRRLHSAMFPSSPYLHPHFTVGLPHGLMATVHEMEAYS